MYCISIYCPALPCSVSGCATVCSIHGAKLGIKPLTLAVVVSCCTHWEWDPLIERLEVLVLYPSGYKGNGTPNFGRSNGMLYPLRYLGNGTPNPHSVIMLYPRSYTREMEPVTLVVFVPYSSHWAILPMQPEVTYCLSLYNAHPGRWHSLC